MPGSRRIWSVLLIGLALSPSSGLAQTEVLPDPRPVDLFNGQDLSAWKLVNTEGNFYVRDGLLVMDKGAGWLATEKTFGDFELRLVYRFVTPGADSGVFIRSELEGKNWTSRGYQVQNMDNDTLGDVVSMGKAVRDKLHSTAEVKLGRRASGEWNELVILAKGTDLVVTLNGKAVGAATVEAEPGHVGLQAEGGVLEFRQIIVNPLD